MIKLMFCITRLPGLTAEEFHNHWRGTHAELVKRHAATFGIVKYDQSHAIVDEPRNQPSAAFPHRYDGVAEVWFKDREHLDLWFDNSTPAAKAAGREIRADERKFADRARSPFIIAESIPVIAG